MRGHTKSRLAISLLPSPSLASRTTSSSARVSDAHAWTRVYVFEAVDGRCTGLCEFELEDEAAAFAYAEERMRRGEQG